MAEVFVAATVAYLLCWCGVFVVVVVVVVMMVVVMVVALQGMRRGRAADSCWRYRRWRDVEDDDL